MLKVLKSSRIEIVDQKNVDSDEIRGVIFVNEGF